jgi:hypothetical protein
LAALSRRRFLSHVPLAAAVGVAAAGGVGAVRSILPRARSTAAVQATGVAPLGEQLIVHIRDVASGEISVMAGTSEVVYRDADVVARLLRGAREAMPAGPGR